MKQDFYSLFSVAPMMEWTDRHYRYFARLITKESTLYTEMITTGAILHGQSDRFLSFDESEHPVVVQLGGSDPVDLAKSAKICEDYGYDEINLNVGCPSDRVQSGKIGACLMAEADLVARCFEAMQKSVSIPVTIKHRLGIDDMDSYQFLYDFVSTVKNSGCKTFIVHARKAILSGLSPKQNREIPPLDYERVYQLKKDFSQIDIVINGGIDRLDDAENHLKYVDGIMMGREAYHNPYILAEVDQRFYQDKKQTSSRSEIVEKILPYIEQQLSAGCRLNHITRHILGLFHGQPNGRLWRRHLSENSTKENAGIDVVLQALQFVK